MNEDFYVLRIKTQSGWRYFSRLGKGNSLQTACSLGGAKVMSANDIIAISYLCRHNSKRHKVYRLDAVPAILQ